MKDKTYSIIKVSVSLLILLAIGITMLCLSWQKWPDILIDFGWELYAPWQISKGLVLYKDILHIEGPLSFYINAFLFKVFGVHLMTIVICNIFLIAVLTWIIYRFFFAITDRLTATAVGAIFLGMFAFSQYLRTGNYNFVCAYSQEMAHGIILSFLAIYLFLIYLKKLDNKLLFIISVLLGLVFLTKAEVFLSLAIALFFGMVFAIFLYKSAITKILKASGIFLLGFFLPIFAFVTYLSRHMPFGKALGSITIFYKTLFGTPLASNIFYQRTMGMDYPVANIQKLLLVAGWYLIIILVLGLIDYAISLISNKKLKVVFIFALFGILYLFIWRIFNRIPWLDMFRALPLVMVVLGICLFISLLRSSNNHQKIGRLLPLLVITIFAFLLLLKMLLNTHIFHYGFALAMPATLLLVMIYIYHIPLFFSKLFGKKFLIRGLAIMLVSIVLLYHMGSSKRVYDLKTFPVRSAGDTILCFNPNITMRGACVQLALEKIKEIMGKDENFAVLPEGIMLNYLARKKNPFPYVNFIPPQLEIFGENKIMESLRRNKPDYIILVHRPVSEFGYRCFGKDYGIKTFAWIKENYASIVTIGKKSSFRNGFEIIITKRKSLNLPPLPEHSRNRPSDRF